MSDNDKRQLNSSEELVDVKSLVRGADGGDFTLEDILAEYGVGPAAATSTPASAPPPTPAEEPVPAAVASGTIEEKGAPDLPWPEAPRRARYSGNVVSFPGTRKQAVEEAEPEEDEDEEPEPAPEPLKVVPKQEAPARPQAVPTAPKQPVFGQTKVAPTQPETASTQPKVVPTQPKAAPMPVQEPEDKIIDFPERKSPLGALFQKLKGKADDYADQMFQEAEQMEEEMPEIRRRELLIPGTDEEDEDDVRYVRRPRREEPPAPDRPPQELAREYGSGLGSMRLRTLGVMLLTAIEVLMILVPTLGFVWKAPLNDYRLQVFIAAGPLVLGMLLSCDVLAQGIIRATQLKFGMDGMTVLACCFTLIDALTLAASQNRQGQLPYCAAAMAALMLTMHGEYHKRCALRLSCRTAAASSEPFRVTQDEGKWNGKDCYAKWSGTSAGFGSQIQVDDGAQRIYKTVCPVLAVACLLLSLIASVGMKKPEHIWWCLSATFTAASALGASITYGRPFHKIARRLSQSGAALAGWPGVLGSARGNRLLVTDGDLFPTGCVTMTRVEIFGEFPLERVTAYAATLIRDAGSGLEKPFYDMLRSQGGLYRTAERLTFYEGGGVSALIRGDQVLVGSSAFMNLMDIRLPVGLNVKNAVFCAIDGELAGIFALNYALPDTVFPSLEALLHEKVAPVLATRDFNIIPAMLQQRFRLAADRMDFPSVQRRRELSDPDQDHSPLLTAVLCREGLYPFAEAVVGARRLRRCTRVGAVVCCIGSTLGILLSFYLTSVSAFVSLSPLNLLIFMVMWLLPVWFLTDWAPRY